MNLSSILYNLSFMILPLLFAVTLHEAAHGWVAKKLGDKTALMMGRVTLNPVKHIDPFGTIMLPIFMLIITHFSFAFGWAKPVPVTWQNFKHPRRDMVLVGAAGPGANILMAILWAFIAKLGLLFNLSLGTIGSFLYATGIFGVYINTMLAILNLIPIPPLDGSRIVSGFLPPYWNAQYSKLEPFGIWILLIIVLIFPQRILFIPFSHTFSFIRSTLGL